MTQLLSLVLLFLAATVFNVNQGVAMTPSMVLYLLFFATAGGVVVIAVDPGDPDVMHRPPRDPGVPITNRSAVVMWLVYATVLFVAAIGAPRGRARRAQPRARQRLDDDDLRRHGPGHGVQRPRQPARPHERPRRPGRSRPWRSVPCRSLMVLLATELAGLQRALSTTSLTGTQWLVCAGLAALLPLTVEVGKVIRRRRAPAVPAISPPEAVVAPERARRGVST